MTPKENAYKIKQILNVERVDVSRCGDGFQSFIISGKGIMLVGVLSEKTNNCVLVNPLTREIVKEIKL